MPGTQPCDQRLEVWSRPLVPGTGRGQRFPHSRLRRGTSLKPTRSGEARPGGDTSTRGGAPGARRAGAPALGTRPRPADLFTRLLTRVLANNAGIQKTRCFAEFREPP